MKYTILKGFLIAGVVLGFGSGFAHVGAHWAMHGKDRGAHGARSCAEGSRWSHWGHRHGRHGDELAPAESPPPATNTTAPER
jgi:hypothetical protein